MAELQQHDDQPQEPVAEFWSFPTDPAEFDNDERISFSRLENKYIAVQEDGAEYEWDGGLKRWIPIVDDALIESHQAAYGGGAAAEEDEAPATTAADRRKKKRKAGGGDEEGGKAKRPRQNTAVYVTGLPLDVTVEEIAELFSRKCGVIAENIDDSSPRIKLYTDGGGNFKGDALVVFFKPQSVDMAIMLLDDTDFRISPSGLSSGRIKVQAADTSYKRNNYDQEGGEGVEGAGGNGNKGRGSAAPAAENGNGGHTRNTTDKAKVIKKAQKMSAKLADWDDDDPYPHLAAAVGAGPGQNGPTNKKAERTVILRHMFTLKELDEDPAALLEIKEDIRDECEKMGEVTNVVLFDLEEDGIVSVRFRTSDAAEACIKLMHGRSFDGRTVQASLATGKEKYRRSKDKDDGLDEDDA
ncbi:hypothetical protein PspLS_07552 [Pyricularia sp. CBS 133598]|nr:hypothetical protein PspLS_07552 [Pyricularia sp. CBS 133598]